MIAVYFIILLVLLFLSMFFSSADMAYGSVSIARLESEKRSKKNDLAIKLSRGYDKTISTILFFNDTVMGNIISHDGAAAWRNLWFLKIFLKVNI